MEMLKLKYQLTEDEISESLLCLNYRREGTFRNINLCVISMLGFVLLAAYIRNPDHFFLFLLLAVIVLMLFYMAYGPAYARKRRAKKMAGKKGEYKLTITNQMLIYGERGEKIQLAQKKLRVYVSNKMYTLKDGREIFAIPKRILTEKQQEMLLQLLRKCQADIIHINIKG